MSTDAESPLAQDANLVPRAVLSEEVRYSGQNITVRSLESLIDDERTARTSR